MPEAFIIIIVIVVGLFATIWHFSRSSSVLDQWAAENGYRIISQNYRHLVKGPFFLRSGKGHAVYYVTVEDESGRQRSGYVRIGGWIAGVLSDKVTVEWDS
jgi:hypothetical protein